VVVTPLNGVMYNSQSRNLSAHGLHPRITHALVNMPLLFLLPYLFLLIRLRQAGVKVRRCGPAVVGRVNLSCCLGLPDGSSMVKLLVSQGR
jgi:hypothetical protein